uniref:Uncharacterized protein n=1 Tax=Anopheles coluzzii TaxID=1518534 RepID=A0A8W7PLT6_ANOCL
MADAHDASSWSGLFEYSLASCFELPQLCEPAPSRLSTALIPVLFEPDWRSSSRLPRPSNRFTPPAPAPPAPPPFCAYDFRCPSPPSNSRGLRGYSLPPPPTGPPLLFGPRGNLAPGLVPPRWFS